MVPNYPDQGTRTAADDESRATNGSVIVITGRADTDVNSIMGYLGEVIQSSVIALNDLATAAHKVFITPTLPPDCIEKLNRLLFEIKTKKKIHCYFIPFVLFLVAHKGILPYPCRDIRNDEISYGFG